MSEYLKYLYQDLLMNGFVVIDYLMVEDHILIGLGCPGGRKVRQDYTLRLIPRD